MYCKISSGGIVGIQAYSVCVEIDIDRGLPAFAMVGSLGNEVRESRERVCVALKNAGYAPPAARVTVNLSPADIHKEGTGFDLPIAIGILQAMEYFKPEMTEGILFLGELGLNGEVQGVRGVLPIVQHAAALGIRQCIVPIANAGEGAVIPGIRVRGAENISQVLAFLQCGEESEREKILPAVEIDGEKILSEYQPGDLDFAQVYGQDAAKRAAEIAAAGFHSLLMTGPPGAGKSMIAKRIPGILPPLTLEESLQVTGIYSVAGKLESGQSLVTARAFQGPHHTITRSALIGGGTIPSPGVISLAHRGVLFLDEFPEFRREVIDSMRQPLEEHRVQIARVGRNLDYPADCMLVCAMNPCPCGYYPDRNRCKCTESQIMRYAGKVSGPIMDRIDLWVELQAVDIKQLQKAGRETDSERIRAHVIRARKMQEARFAGTKYRFNADMESADIERFCALGTEERELMEQLYQKLQLTARSYHRILKIARTIADLEEAEVIRAEHLLEAACYRPGVRGTDSMPEERRSGKGGEVNGRKNKHKKAIERE